MGFFDFLKKKPQEQPVVEQTEEKDVVEIAGIEVNTTPEKEEDIVLNVNENLGTTTAINQAVHEVMDEEEIEFHEKAGGTLYQENDDIAAAEEEPEVEIELTTEETVVPEDAEAFYANRTAHLKEWLDTEAKDQFSEEEKAFLVEKYQEMETPLYYDYADGWKQLFEFAPTLLMIMVLILGFLAASLFSCEYQYKADSVFFASCHGRGRAVSAKIKAGFLLITGIYWLSVLLYVGIVLGILGADGANCVIQTGRGGWKSFYNITYWQEGLLVFAGGYAGCLFILFLTMLISAASRSAVVAVMTPFILIFVPSFLGGIRFPLINKILGLMPDQLLQMNMVVSYFNLYSIAGRIMGAAGIILVVYSVMTVMICPLLYRIYRKAQVK